MSGIYPKLCVRITFILTLTSLSLSLSLSLPLKSPSPIPPLRPPPFSSPSTLHYLSSHPTILFSHSHSLSSSIFTITLFHLTKIVISSLTIIVYLTSSLSLSLSLYIYIYIYIYIYLSPSSPVTAKTRICHQSHSTTTLLTSHDIFIILATILVDLHDGRKV